MRKKILLTGKTGQVGSQLVPFLGDLGDVIAPAREALNLLDPESIRSAVRAARPDIIVNAAAYTAVDAAENDTKAAYAVNAEAPAVLAEEANRAGAALVHYSTDYVFDGSKADPYLETDATAPMNVYGKSKLAGEQAIQASGVPHLIFRTAWIYSAGGKNFLLTILRLATQREELRIVRDQFGAPTWSGQVASSTARILRQITQQGSISSTLSQTGGIYHMTAAGQTTWFEFAKAILEAAAQVPRETPWFSAATSGKPIVTRHVVPISTSEYPTPASRPAYSVLSNARLAGRFGFALPDWRAQLNQCLGLAAAATRSC